MARNRPTESTEAEKLTIAVDELRDELRIVRQVIDELREVVDYISRNSADDRWRASGHLSVTSMPLDPCAQDFGDGLNSVPTEVREAMRQELSGDKGDSETADSQGDLF